MNVCTTYLQGYISDVSARQHSSTRQKIIVNLIFFLTFRKQNKTKNIKRIAFCLGDSLRVLLSPPDEGEKGGSGFIYEDSKPAKSS